MTQAKSKKHYTTLQTIAINYQKLFIYSLQFTYYNQVMSIFTGEWQCTKVENLDSVLKAKMPDITPDQISRYSSPEYWINYKFEIAADNLSMRMMTYNLNTEPILSEFDSTIVFNKNVSKIEGIYNVWSISARTLTAKWYSDSSSSSNSSQAMNVTTIFTVSGDQMLEYGDFNGIIARRHFKRADHQIPKDDKNRGDENVVQNQKKIYKNNKKIIRDPRIKIPKNKSNVVARIKE